MHGAQWNLFLQRATNILKAHASCKIFPFRQVLILAARCFTAQLMCPRFRPLYIFVLDNFLNGYDYILVQEHLSQPNAQKKCESLNATLASILSDEENSLIQTLTSEEYSNCGTG